jgi:molybdopterin/thiamine biosynthesis adenylyltransferase
MKHATDRKMAASRPIGVAQGLGAKDLDQATVFSRIAILTGEKDALGTRNGRWCFISALRLLSRVVGNLQVVLPANLAEFRSEVGELVPQLWSQGRVDLVEMDEACWGEATAILNVGHQVRAGYPWTSILSNGWVARCTSGTTPISADCDQANPIAAMLAASLGVTEVFKRVYGVPVERAALLDCCEFSLFEFSQTPRGLGPILPAQVQIPNTLLLGAGAIGNAIALLISQLQLTGNLTVIDKQVFGDENFGTCVLLDKESAIGRSKAVEIAAWLERTNSHIDAKGIESDIESVLSGDILQEKLIDVVINGLDDVAARHAVQKLWPNILVDGAINSIGSSVVTHSMAHREFSCLRCTFELPNKDHLKEQSEATGLSRASLEGDQNRPISDADIDAADEASQPWLREQQRLGRTICSTMQVAQIEGLGLRLKKGFLPSVPFIASAAAALVMAQMLRNLLWPDEEFVHQFQFPNMFDGVESGHRFARFASKNCECMRHSIFIDKVLAKRASHLSVQLLHSQ